MTKTVRKFLKKLKIELPYDLAIPLLHIYQKKIKSRPRKKIFTLMFSVCMCLVAQSCPSLCDPMDCSPPGSSVHGDSPGKSTGVGCHALFWGIFPTQGSNPGLPQCMRFLCHLSYQRSPMLSVALFLRAKT